MRMVPGALAVAVLFSALSAGFTAPARAETLVIYCTDHNRVHPYPPETFYIDIGAATVHYDDAETRYTVSAAITEQQIDWNWNSSVYSLDRYSGTMHREVLGQYYSSWDCRRIQKRTIE